MCVSLYLSYHICLCCCTQTWSSFSKWGLLSSCGAWASHCGGFSSFKAWASVVVVDGLLSTGFIRCGACSLWNPPRPGIEPMSPALVGRFLTSRTPGKCHLHFLNHRITISCVWKVLLYHLLERSIPLSYHSPDK